MILPLCPKCGQPADWKVHRLGRHHVQMVVKCFICSPQGGWDSELVEIIRKPKGKAGLWPSATDVPIAPVDSSTI